MAIKYNISKRNKENPIPQNCHKNIIPTKYIMNITPQSNPNSNDKTKLTKGTAEIKSISYMEAPFAIFKVMSIM